MFLSAKRNSLGGLITTAALVMMPISAQAEHAAHADWQQVIERIEALEDENKALKARHQKMSGKRHMKRKHREHQQAHAAKKHHDSAGTRVSTDPALGYAILDPTSRIRSKQLLILEQRNNGNLRDNSVLLQGAVTAIANYQDSNEADRFGYLMRHPTGNNQVGTSVSEAVIHSAQLGMTATLGDWVSANVEMLFDPEQSFGPGSNTDIGRNQVHVRKAYVLFGNLERSPFYGSLGKMAIPFGLMDTVNPFTASTVWHVFGGLANGATVGYKSGGLNVSAMAVEGGAQFRAANTPVNGTSVPSKLNNNAIDANYTFAVGNGANVLLGASYLRGSAYCQGFPITHFTPCSDNNPAWDVYTRFQNERLTVKAEFAETTEKWPGTFNPNPPLSQFAASDVTSFDVGAKYRITAFGVPADISAEFSRFDAGPEGADWEKQDQYVAGFAAFIEPSVKVFAEYIHTDGFAPLNFLSGGLGGDPLTPLSSGSAHSDVYMIGVNAAF